MRQEQTFSERSGGNRWVLVITAMVFAGSFIGLFMGVTESPEFTLPTPAHGEVLHSENVIPARSYSEMAAQETGPNRNWPGTIAQQAPTPPPPPPEDLSEQQLLELKQASLARRSERRAYNGAPPVVPHPVIQRDSTNCVSCHGEGLVMGEQVAPKMSHEYYVNCLQCHSPNGEDRFEANLVVENHFDGIPAPIEGDRAWIGAPPVIPHSTQMRSDCRSCHGPTGLPGLRTSHPERQNCLQCHAPSAELNQQPNFFVSLQRNGLLPDQEEQ